MTSAYDMWAIRKAVAISQWDAYGDLIARSRREPKEPIDQAWLGMLPELRANGFVWLPVTADAGNIRDWFRPLIAGGGPHIYSGPNQYFHCYPSGYVIRCPPLLGLMNDPRLLGLVESYLGCWPTLYSMNVWWSDPAPTPQLDHMQRFHRDRDDWRFLTLFAYMTDVDESTGPHQIILGSHKHDDTGSGKEFDEHCERKYADSIHTVTGMAGTVFLCNTIALHRGLRPKDGSRLIAWGRYGLGPNINSFDLEQGPIAASVFPYKPPDTPKNRYINRLLLDYEAGPRLEKAS